VRTKHNPKKRKKKEKDPQITVQPEDSISKSNLKNNNKIS